MDDYLIHLLEEFKTQRLTRREMLRRASVAGLSLSALAPLLAARAAGNLPEGIGSAATSAVAGGIKRGGTLRLASPVPSANPDPVTVSNAGQLWAYEPSLEYLCFARDDWTLEPRLATSWKAGATPQTWTFTIRQGVKWHDGSSFTVDDVVATFQRILYPSVGSSAGSTYRGVLSLGNIERLSDTEVRFHLDKPFVDFPYLVSGFAHQSAILPKNYEVGSFTKGGIGTGPFILKEYVPQRSAAYVANPHYWQSGLPYLAGLTITFYADPTATVLAMQGGDVDVYPEVPLQGAEPILRSGNFTILNHASANYRTMHMRVDSAPFNDKRIRQAIAYCLNRDELVKTLFGGAAQVANDHSWAPIYGYSEEPIRQIPQRKQDYAKAKSLLAEAGLASGFSVTLTTENFSEVPAFAVAIKQYCQAAGIIVNLNVMTTSQYYGSGTNQPWLVVPFGITDWAARGTAAQTVIPAFPCGAVWNSAHWCNPAFDKLLTDYNGELDNQKRSKLALQCAQIQNDEVPAVIAYWISGQRATTSKVHGLAPAPDTNIDLRSVWLS